MMKSHVQEAAEVLEQLVEKESKEKSSLTMKEFMALNSILLHLQAKGDYILPGKYRDNSL
ncbi:hypothetical protein AB1283_01090 [Bacillus sp. S13(2024)]|uniref:hypothetical protein n=1 Tax=Bacillus sp. S13(2024) TaxID=3162885 RepID=UPI003D1CEA81